MDVENLHSPCDTEYRAIPVGQVWWSQQWGLCFRGDNGSYNLCSGATRIVGRDEKVQWVKNAKLTATYGNPQNF